MRKLLLSPLTDLTACLERLASGPRPGGMLAVTTVSLIVTWFVYVPIHELLHALGCVITGGTVSELEIAPQYGGALLARWFPFVVSGGEYAGRLSGFDTGGSDLIYLATDFMPYVLTVVFGVPLLKLCARRRRPILFGVGIVVGLAPFYNVIGDYFEMGSIIVTRAFTAVRGSDVVLFSSLRSDDVFKLIGDVCTKPDTLGLSGAGGLAGGSIVIFLSFMLGVALAVVTYALGHGFARVLIRQPRASARTDVRAG